MFGKLSLEAIPLHEPIVVVTVSAILMRLSVSPTRGRAA
jgi:hypothetical protein